MSGIDTYTKLLLHCNGTDGSTTFTDSAIVPKTVTANGTAQIDTAQKKFGTASCLLDGNSDYLSIPDSDDFYFGADPFTIDLWARHADVTYQHPYYAQVTASNKRFTFSKYPQSAYLSRIYFVAEDESGNTLAVYIGSTSLVANTWYHLALVRNGANVYIFVNGVAESLTESHAIDASTSFSNKAVQLEIGHSTESSDPPCYMNGWIDELRISKGIARWTSNFTPPASEYTKSGGAFIFNIL